MWTCEREWCENGISVFAKEFHYCEECYNKMMKKLCEITFNQSNKCPTQKKN